MPASRSAADRSSAPISTRTSWTWCRAEQVEGLYGCLDYYQTISDPFSKKLLDRYNTLFPAAISSPAAAPVRASTAAMKLWEAAVTEAGSLRQDDVIEALDHARIAEGPGGPAEMVPGQHHVRMNMYIAQANNGKFKIVKNLGAIDPNEAMVPTDHTVPLRAAAGR